jgi:phage shock protein B
MLDIDFNAIALAFVFVLLPLWIVLHYMSRWRTSRGLAAQDEKMLIDLWDAARRMEERLENLERVLAADTSRKNS